MKKLLSLVLSAMLVMGTSLVAYAAPTTEQITSNSATKTVKVSSSAYVAVYRIDVTWDNLDFTYNFSNWDPDTIAYGLSEGWAENGQKTITVENRSNAPVLVDAKFSNNSTTSETKNGVKATITADGSSFRLDSADIKGVYDVNTLPTKTLTVTVDGRPTVKDPFDLDNIVIKIDKNA